MGPDQRIERVDALRGMALLGIVQVNIQSFTWGTGEPLGYLWRPPGLGESALYFLQAALLEGKFYPIFAFLFGVGIALQTRKLRRRSAGDLAAARSAYRRRLAILLVLGIAHGFLLYFGDVLSAYAACALVFAAIAPARPRRLVVFAAGCWAAAMLSIFLPVIFGAVLDAGEPTDQIPASILLAHTVYCQGSFLAQMRQRWIDEAWQQLASIPVFWPQVIALFALGVIAGRLGWLQHPERHPLVWRRAWRIGLGIGLPCALLGAAMSLARAREQPGAIGGWDEVVLGASSVLAAAYVAGAVHVFAQPWGTTLCRWLACAGRVSLSNYVGQSVAMGALLSGWGLGLGANASRAQLAALALAIFAAQVVLSRWLLANWRQGPLEALWRYGAYRTYRARR